MIEYKEELYARDDTTIFVPENPEEAAWLSSEMAGLKDLALDTESTSFQGMYRPDWHLRLVQFGTADEAFVFPVEFKNAILGVFEATERRYILHNVPHDLLSLDLWLGLRLDLWDSCIDTHILAHLYDSRPRHEGGTGLGLKDLASSLLGVDAGKWETRLKAAFKEIKVPVPGEVYKSANKKLGRAKGDPKMRKINMSEGWRHIDTYNEAYLRYSGMDVILEYNVYEEIAPKLRKEYGHG